jgi:hypothetical protein
MTGRVLGFNGVACAKAAFIGRLKKTTINSQRFCFCTGYVRFKILLPVAQFTGAT